MHEQYQAIQLEGDILVHYRQTTGQSDSLPGLSPINLFIGPNNSGKSRLIRGLYAAGPYKYQTTGIPRERVVELIEPIERFIGERLDPFFKRIGPIHVGMFSDYLKAPFWESRGDINLTNLKGRLKEISNVQTIDNFEKKIGGSGRTDMIPHMLNDIQREVNKALEALGNHQTRVGGETRYYIPVLRGLRTLTDKETGDLYRQRTAKDYQIPHDDTHRIFTGEELYAVLRDHLLGTHEKRALIDQYETFLSEEFFDRRIVELTPRHGEDVVYIRIGESEEYPIYSLGDGLQSILILTFPAFVATTRSLFFMEEPDLYLHPGMQRKLIEVFATHEKFAQHQFFFTSHSNHLLDLTADYPQVSVFSVSRGTKEQRFKIQRVGDWDRNILHEIGARSSSVFLTNATIWVEGISDRLYLRAYLNKYLRDHKEVLPLKEDTHFSIIELGGGNLVHFSFDDVSNRLEETIGVLRVCGQNFVILDGDNRGKGDREERLKEALAENFLIFNGKEIENTLPREVVLAACDKVLGSTKDHKAKKLSAVGIVDNEYQSKSIGLGGLLDKKLGIQYFGTEKTGTFKSRQKMDFCRAAVKFMESDDHWALSAEATDLCRRLIEFVQLANGPAPKRTS
jgi:hypothetical protein